MKHRSKLLALAAVLAVAGLGVFVSSSVGGGAVETAPSIDLTRSEGETIKGGNLKLVDTVKAPLAASASAKSAKLFYYLSEHTFTVQPGYADFREIRCPVKQQPATGGVHAIAPGLAITNSSRANPTGATLSGAWYQEVTNVTTVPLTWQVHLTCVSK